MRKVLPELLEKFYIIHLCGKGNLDNSLTGTIGYAQFEYASSELTDMFEKVMKTVNYSIETFTEQTEEHLKEIVALEKEVDVLEKELQHNHVRRLATNECKAKSSIFSDMVSNLERVSDHATNIAFAIYDEDQYNIY